MYKIISFLIALLIGLSLPFAATEAVLFAEGDHESVSSDVNTTAACDASPAFHKGVSVELIRIVEDRFESRAEFLISNNGCEPVKYWGYGEKSPLHMIKIDGKEEQLLWCGTGLEEEELSPGDSLSVSIPTTLISNRGTQDSIYSVGFMSSWSDEFRLPISR